MKLTKEIINEKVEQLRKELLDMVEPKFEVGKWYKNINGTLRVYTGKNTDSYGISCHYDKHWFCEPCTWDLDHKWTLATPSEVQYALEAEAVKIGYTETNFKCLAGSTVNLKGRNNYYYYREDVNRLYYGIPTNANCVFNNGVWATIIPQEKTSEEWANEYHTQGLHLNNWLNKNNLKIIKK